MRASWRNTLATATVPHYFHFPPALIFINIPRSWNILILRLDNREYNYWALTIAVRYRALPRNHISLPCTHISLPCTTAHSRAAPVHYRAVPCITTQSRAIPRSPVHYRAVPLRCRAVPCIAVALPCILPCITVRLWQKCFTLWCRSDMNCQMYCKTWQLEYHWSRITWIVVGLLIGDLRILWTSIFYINLICHLHITEGLGKGK